MSIRDTEKQKTNQRLREALQRLIVGEPTNSELKRRAKLKVSARTVQQEAGVSIGVIRHHPEVAKLIADYKSGRVSYQTEELDGVADEVSSGDLLKLQLEVDKLKNKVQRLTDNLKKEKALKEEYRAHASELKAQNEELLSRDHLLVQALFNKVPLPDRDELFKKVTGLNVVQFNFGDEGNV